MSRTRERRAVRRRSARPIAGLAAAWFVALMVGACSGGPILANPRTELQPLASPAPTSSRPADPVPVAFPADDRPHDRLTEWWYYTGHLRDRATGAHYGFEFVIFRAERGDFPVSWASHLAITDEAGDAFHYAQRSEIGATADRSASGSTGFDLAIRGLDPTDPATAARSPWTMSGTLGADRLTAALTPAEAATAGAPGGLGLDLRLTATKPPALQGDGGWVDFGPAGGSYYYSRTALTATGTLDLEGRTLEVDGSAWFDHQWGDFIAIGGGGWDWFAVNLADGTDLTFSLVRAGDGTYPLVDGTLVAADGATRHLDRSAFSVTSDRTWKSPLTGATYPAGWRISLPGEGLVVELTPTVAAQELDTRATTGVVYWEGSQRVSATRNGRPLDGQAYVELTGYR